MSLPVLPDPLEIARKRMSDLENRLLDRVVSGFGGVVSGIGNNARSMVADAARSLTQRAMDLIRLLGSVNHAIGNMIADALRGSDARSLTGGERTMVIEAYGRRVDPEAVRVVRGAGRCPIAELAFLHGNPAITVGNTIYIAPKTYESDRANDLSITDRGTGLLIHEYMHVTQYARFGFGSFAGRYLGELATHHCDPDELYDYDHRKLDFEHETLEGQAQIAGNYAQFRRSADPSTRALAARAEAKLKGTGVYGK